MILQSKTYPFPEQEIRVGPAHPGQMDNREYMRDITEDADTDTDTDTDGDFDTWTPATTSETWALLGVPGMAWLAMTGFVWALIGGLR